jgi:V/A-type H+-transporting ATPase subunit C
MARLDRVNARVGARRARLFGAERLRELLVRPALGAQVELLVRGGLLAAPPAEAEGSPLTAVEAALRSAVRRDEALLLAEAEGRRARRLLAAAVGLHEARAVKVLLRGVAHAVAPERTAALAPPTEALPEERLRDLAASPSPEALAERLAAAGSDLAAPLSAGLPERDRAGLLPAEVEVDRAAFARIATAAAGRGEDAEALREWLADRADIRNALTLLAMGPSVPARDLSVPGGRALPREAFARLAQGGAEERRRAAAAIASCGAERLADPAVAERELERWGARRLHVAARRRPLSLAVPLAWLEARREEVRRVAVVLRGTALGLPGEAILDLVEA